MRTIRRLAIVLSCLAAYVCISGWFFFFIPLPNQQAKVKEMEDRQDWSGLSRFADEGINRTRPQANHLAPEPESANDPNKAPYYYLKGYALAKMDRLDEAKVFFAKAVTAKSGAYPAAEGWVKEIESRLARREALARAAAVPQAPVSRPEPVISISSGPAPAPVSIPPAARELLRAAQEAVVASPNRASAWVTLGQRYLDVEQYAESIKAYRAALQLDNASAEAHFGIGAASARAGDRAGATEAYRALKERDAPLAERLFSEHLMSQMAEAGNQAGQPQIEIVSPLEAQSLAVSDLCRMASSASTAHQRGVGMSELAFRKARC